MGCGCGQKRIKDPITLCDQFADGSSTTYVMTFDKSGNATLTLEDLTTPYTPTGVSQVGGPCAP